MVEVVGESVGYEKTRTTNKRNPVYSVVYVMPLYLRITRHYFPITPAPSSAALLVTTRSSRGNRVLYSQR